MCIPRSDDEASIAKNIFSIENCFFLKFDCHFQNFIIVRAMCPSSSLSLTMDGYFHKHSWFRANPCNNKIIFSCGFHSRAQTWDSMSIEFTVKSVPILEFKNWWSNRQYRHPLPGDSVHEETRPELWPQLNGPSVEREEQYSPKWWHPTPHKHNLLSLPPLASVSPSMFHCNPHPSCEWLRNVATLCWAMWT
jgi:hypothetical protein